ncbi:glycosyltransferase [Marinicrinis sediminis]|uniref:Glycosyltransferase n=1 Tax=Marinicrinis sediminis TaxID=1652465 RepID=A0ABW5RFH9_9BACL
MHVFIGLSGGMGPVLRTVPIARQLVQNKMKVTFSVYGPSSQMWIERLGFRHEADTDPTMPGAAFLLPKQPHFYHLDHYYAQQGLLDRHFLSSWIEHRIHMLEKLEADVVIADLSPHTLIAAKVLGIPSISLTQSCLHASGKPLNYWTQTPRNIPKVVPVLNDLLRSYQLPPIERMEECNRGDLDMVPSIPELDPFHDRSVQFVGPISMDLHTDSPSLRPFQEPWPVILVYPGRMTDAAGASGNRLVQAVVQAFGNRPVHVILATDEKLPPALHHSTAFPQNIQIVASYNEEMLGKADLFIHHGGHGSCLSALMSGVPSLIIPTQTEREFNARQAASLGIAEYMLPDTFTSAHLYELSRYMLDDHYQDRTLELRKAVLRRGYRGAKEVSDKVKLIYKRNVHRS